VPEIPAAPTTTTQSSSSITFSWLEPANNGSNIDDYKVLWCIGSNPACTFSTLAASTTGLKTLTLGSLTKGSYYQFKVQAHNVIGYSASSTALLVVAADPPSQPNTPTLDAANTHASQISVNWLAPADNGGSAITSYTLYWKLSTSGIYTDSYSTTNTATLTHIITGLTAGAYYDIKVQAFNIVGGSIHSGAIRLVAATKPNAPVTPTLVSQSSTSIQIAWLAPYDGGAAITSY